MCDRAVAITVILAGSVLLPVRVCAQAAPWQANAEVANLTRQFGLPVTTFAPLPGNYTLSASQSLTASALPQGVVQSNVPQSGTVPDFPLTQQDGVVPPPYASAGLTNFRFDHFNNLFAFFGYYTWSTEDYAALHGFNALGGSYRDATSD